MSKNVNPVGYTQPNFAKVSYGNLFNWQANAIRNWLFSCLWRIEPAKVVNFWKVVNLVLLAKH